MREDNHVHVVENVEVEIKKRSKKKNFTVLIYLTWPKERRQKEMKKKKKIS